eukprot:2146813-Prymnesium_polylepis.1
MLRAVHPLRQGGASRDSQKASTEALRQAFGTRRRTNMGFLELGDPIPWKESRDVIAYVRKHGIKQFIAMYNKVRTIENDELLWGDELEYGIFVVDEQAGTVKLSLRSAEILKTLQQREEAHPTENGCHWVPEYGSWMVEGTPEKPYKGFADDLLS